MGQLLLEHRSIGLPGLAHPELTEREIEFLELVCSADEHTYKEIADRMGVHRRTVDGYREAIFQKFGVKSKVGLVLFAIRLGVVPVWSTTDRRAMRRM